MKKLIFSLSMVVFLPLGFSTPALADDDYMPSLITTTPLEGRTLAITIVRKTIGTIQQDADIKNAVREKYQDEPDLLMQAAELVAYEFRTIAEANNYWRE